MIRQVTMERIMYRLLLFVWIGSSVAVAQVAPSAVSGSKLGAFISFGGQRTRVIDFNYNALGVDGGLYIQHSPLIGAEVRAATFPMYARFSQAPITAGYRAEMRWQNKYYIAGYAGGGMSKAQNAGAHYVLIPVKLSPCWQVSQSTAIDLAGHWKWKLYEATYTDTYTTRRKLPGLSLTTGVVYSFFRNHR